MQTLANIGQINEVELGNITLRYLKAGSGAPLILLHTIRTQLEYFSAVIPALAQHYRVYAVDLPGHGMASIDSKAPYDEPYFRAAIKAFIEKLSLADVTLVGESIGAVIALTVSAELPNRVVKVVASNPYDYETRYGDGLRRGNFIANFIIGNFGIPFSGAIFAALENKILLDLVMRGGFHKTIKMPDELLTAFNKAGFRRGYRYVERKVFAGWRTWSAARLLYSSVKAPVKLIYAEFDWSRDRERKRTAQALGDVSMHTISGTGHFAFVDNPQKMIEAILA